MGSAARTRFDDLARELRKDGVSVGVHFQHRALKSQGEAVLCLEEDGVVIRLPADSEPHREALAQEDAHLFDPSGRAPLDDWVVVPLSASEHWSEWAHAAVRAVREAKDAARYR